MSQQTTRRIHWPRNILGKPNFPQDPSRQLNQNTTDNKRSKANQYTSLNIFLGKQRLSLTSSWEKEPETATVWAALMRKIVHIEQSSRNYCYSISDLRNFRNFFPFKSLSHVFTYCTPQSNIISTHSNIRGKQIDITKIGGIDLTNDKPQK